jgi:predicted nuclease of predicted toxin-antitoxin system
MTFFFDQDAPDDLAHWLRHRGHAVTLLREVLPVTAPDEVVLAEARTRGAVLITCNRKDFLELARTHEHAGMVILIRRRTRQSEIAGMQRLLAGAGEQSLANNVNFA